jgi:prepilin-type processing-associated H-X9-DG protein
MSKLFENARRRYPVGFLGKDQVTADCPLNCTNDSEFYGFHSGGCNAAFADGSVRFISQSISLTTLAALVTRAGGEIPGGDF